MVGETKIINGVEYEVVWDGGEGLVSERETKFIGIWDAPKRLYNKQSDYWEKPRKKVIDPLDDEEVVDAETVLRHSGKTPIVELGDRRGD